jgi:O-antigen ligase
MNSSTGIGPSVNWAWTALRDAFGGLGAGALCLLLVALSAAPALVPVSLVAFLVGIVHHQRRSLRWLLKPDWRTPLPWMAVYYLLHVLGMGWTEDVGFGLFDLEIKLPLLVMPLVALTLPTMPREARDAAFFLGALASAAAVLFYLAAALVRIGAGSALEVSQELFSARFSFLVHPSYLALYLAFALAAWVLTPVHQRMPGVMGATVLVLLCIGMVLCGSKMGWILLVLTLIVTLILRWRETALRKLVLGLAGVSIAGLVGLIVLSPHASSRVEEAFRAAFSDRVDEQAETSSAVRRITWSAATTLIAEQPLLGTGTGDIKNELLRLYDERGQDWVLEHRLNAHSQFLQSAACLGIAGGMVLVLMLLLPLTGPWRRDPLVLIFLLACSLNWAVESMLEVQAGVVWTALMALLLFRSTPDHGAADRPTP